MIECPIQGRKGVALIEVLIVLLIISIVAAIAQPRLTSLVVKARAADAISDMQIVRLAAFNYQTDQQAWPSDVSSSDARHWNCWVHPNGTPGISTRG